MKYTRFVLKGDIAYSLDRTTIRTVPNGYLVCIDGHSAGVFDALPETYQNLPVLDYTGKLILPGLVDLHVHLREPGQEDKETIATGCAAAARGGVTTLVAMPNTRPATDCPEVVALVKEKAAHTGIHVYPAGAVTQGQKGEALTDFQALWKAGVPAFTDDGVPVQNLALLRQAMQQARTLGLPILDHCEDKDMVRNYAVNEGAVSRQLGLPGRPAIAEELQVMRDVMLAKETGARVHICHISTAGTVNIIRRAKAEGVAVTCETCPQYFILTEEEVLRQGTMARVNPPLRTAADRAAILEGLKDGTIDAIVTDHAPHCAWEKAQPLEKAPSGMVGLETSLGLALTYLYHAGHMSLMKVIDRMSTTPASLLRLPGGTLQEGRPADLVLFDPDQVWTVNRDTFASKGRNTPFHGFQLKGKVKYTISMGQIIYQEDERDVI